VQKMLADGYTVDRAATVLGWHKRRVTARQRILELPETAQTFVGSATRLRCLWRSRWHASLTQPSRRSSMQAASSSRPWWRSRWWMPAFSLFLGALMFGAFAIGGNAGQGAFSFGVMAAVGALFLFGARSETLQGLGGPGRDERWAMIDLRATALAGTVTITVIIGAFLYEVADGHDGSPYSQLGAVAGVAYVLGVLLLRRRS
jgi:hypothetical protein